MVPKQFKHLKTVQDISEYELKSNGLRVLYKHVPDTGVVTTNVTYLVGARDEGLGETGATHMLEHMLFKPTKYDLEKKQDAAAMQFEREVGVILNANTWKDRTTYFFSCGKEHLVRALTIEAERMRGLVLTDKEFQPERNNVLSEFDMYNGDPSFALAVDMVCVAFHSHPYGHETIGFREDISAYTTDMLQKFYDHFYRPNNAVLMVVGDVELTFALKNIASLFGHLESEPSVKIRPQVVEPKQEGVRRVEIVRAGTTNILALGVKHDGFPSHSWFETMLVFNLLTDGVDSVLHKALVDTGLASNVSSVVEPTRDKNLGVIYITLTKKINHQKMEEKVLRIIRDLGEDVIKKKLKNLVTLAINSEIFGRDSSLNIVQELTEYVSSGNWPAYFETEKLLKSITHKQIKTRLTELFADQNLTIGVYKSK